MQLHQAPQVSQAYLKPADSSHASALPVTQEDLPRSAETSEKERHYQSFQNILGQCAAQISERGRPSSPCLEPTSPAWGSLLFRQVDQE